MVSYLTTMFLGKTLRGSLQVFSAHSFTSNYQLALLESAEEGKIFQCTIPPGDTRGMATLYSLAKLFLSSRNSLV